MVPKKATTAACDSRGIVRVASLASVPVLLRDMGADPVRVLENVGLDPRVFTALENSIALVDAGRILETCAKLTECPHFGLLVGQRGGIFSLGALGALMRHSPTVDAALQCLTLHSHLRTRGGVPTHTVDGEWATLGYAIYLRGMPGTAYTCDLAIASAFNIMRTLCGGDWLPDEVQFAHAKPRDVGPYQRLFRSPLRFDADCTAIVFSRRWLDQPLPGSDAALHQLRRSEIAEHEALNVEDLADRVRRVLRTMLVTGRGAEEHVAELFSIHPRTLHRRLRAQATSLRSLVEEGRCEIACQLLRDTNLNVTEIAAVLDYSDATALTRAFRRWMNCPPAAWRAEARSAQETDVALKSSSVLRDPLL